MNISTTFAARRGQFLAALAVLILFILHVTGVLDLQLEMGSKLKVHAPLLREAIASGSLPPIVRSLDFLVFTLCGGILVLLLPWLNPIRACLLTGAVASLPFIAEIYLPGKQSFIPFQYTLLVILVLFGMHILINWLQETRERQRLAEVFGQYVPPELVAGITATDAPLALEGQTREMTVMFCDIKGFTRISENLGPQELARLLNDYFTRMTAIIYRHGGTVDKYIGDAIMAFWGAPVSQADHPQRAVAAAREMQNDLVSLREEFAARQWPGIEVGIGINTGTMSVGNMGSQYRIAYTVVGDAVNLAARLENLTRAYDTGIIVSEHTRTKLGDLPMRELDYVRVKGKDVATRIYEPLDSVEVDLNAHDEALQAYYQGEWSKAIRAFEALSVADAQRRDYYEMFAARARELSAAPPGDSWNGSTQAGTY